VRQGVGVRRDGRPAGGQPPVVAVSSLFQAKLRAPVIPQHYVRRPRLLALIDDAVAAPLTVVTAPAGSGKTSLLSGWAGETTMPVAWLSLDEADRDAVQLWTGVIAALETLMPGCGVRATKLIRRPGLLAEAVAVLLDDLEAADHGPTVLIIDDAHLVDEDDIVAASLELFVRHLPSSLHLVLLARRTPRLPIDRLRARGLLAEVHFAELRFSHEESCQLLSRLAPALIRDRIDATATHADGWAAGLQLAAIAARSTRAREGLETPTAEDDLLVADYLLHEVLAGEPPEVVDALFDVSVADRINLSLAKALTGRADAAELLLQAEARGLFVSRLDVEGWSEVHSLIRSALVDELGRRSPGRLEELHITAAKWFEGVGETPLALEHWLLADRPRDALRLLAERNAELYDSGREMTIIRTIGGIPREVAAANLDAMLEFAWCHLLVDRRRFLEMVDQVTWWAGQASNLDETIRGRVSMLQSIAATIGGDWAAGTDLARRSMRELGERWLRDPLGRFGWNMIARNVALSEGWDDSGGDVRAADLALSRDSDRRLALEGTRALGEALAGRPVDSLRVAAGVRHTAEVTNMTILRGELAVAEAVALRELGDRPRALAELESLAQAGVEPVPYCRVLAALNLVQTHLDEGDLESARRRFDEAESLVDSDFPGPGGREWLARVGTLLAVACGDVELARRRSERDRDPFWGGVSAARVHLADGDRTAAIAALDTAVPRCPRHEVIRELLRSRAVESHDEALKHVIAAIERATADGMLQTVASEGPEVVELVEHAASRVPKAWMDRLRRAATTGREGLQRDRQVLGESLTERERDVLRFLPSRLTLREIAAELFVSVNTLKFHLKVIYRKLGVQSRAEAAEIARAMTSPGDGQTHHSSTFAR